MSQDNKGVVSIDRRYNLDSLKGVSIYFVVVLHLLSIVNVDKNVITDGIILNVSRFAVPCFFMVSGYLSGQKIIDFGSRSAVIRLMYIFLFWNLFYLLIPMNFEKISVYGFFKVKYWDFYQIVSDPVKVCFQGFYGHLWFLESLAWAFLFLSATSKISFKLGFIISCIAYMISVLAGGYENTEIGINLPFTSRNGPFVSTFFVMLGYYASKRDIRPDFSLSLFLLFLGLFIQFAEYFYLRENYHIAVQYEFLFGTPFFSLGVFLLFLGLENKKNLIALLGRFSLGIYVLHVVFADYVATAIRTFHFDLDYVLFVPVSIFVYCMSLVFTKLLMLNNKLKRFIA